MALTVVGSIVFDSVRTPFGERDRMLGGSAVHFALAASFFTDVRVVGPVGDDFGEEEISTLTSHGIETADIERVDGGETFFWRGHYEHDLNVAHTDDTQLNVFAEFEPKLSETSRSSDLLFLGNIQPDLQRRVRAEASGARFAALDSMNLWIDTARDSLVAAISEVDCLLLNDAEIRMLTERAEPDPRRPAVHEIGPRIVVAKRGEYGAVLFSPEGPSPCPRCCSRTSGTRRVQATASRAASSATSTASATVSRRWRSCGARWSTARRWRPSTSGFGSGEQHWARSTPACASSRP